MFTPPPSPQPTRPTELDSVPPGPLSLDSQERYASAQASKRYIGRRFRMAVILIPLLVIFVTARMSYAANGVVEKTVEPMLPLSWHGQAENSNWRHHKRHPEPQTQVTRTSGASLSSAPSTASATSTAPTPSSTAIPVSSQPIPSIPSSPPPLPTPFPQPFDGGIAQNFSSLSCSNFFSNMTNSAPFRQCRPFSMLLQNSAAFINV